MYPANKPKESAAITPITIPAIAPPPKLVELSEFVCVADGDAADAEAADAVLAEVVVAELVEELCEDEIDDELIDELVDVYPGIRFLCMLQRTRAAVSLKPSTQVVYWGQHASEPTAMLITRS
jgi:hypothetical protein